jgi:hypothetical protein
VVFRKWKCGVDSFDGDLHTLCKSAIPAKTGRPES